jgi:Tol biopolymer transport system component
LLLESQNNKRPESWSPDGRSIAFYELPLAGVPQLWLLPLNSRKPQQFSPSRFAELMGQFSPNGKWLAYASSESGGPEVYVQAGGDGKELFYAKPSIPTQIMAADIAEKKRRASTGNSARAI